MGLVFQKPVSSVDITDGLSIVRVCGVMGRDTEMTAVWSSLDTETRRHLFTKT